MMWPHMSSFGWGGWLFGGLMMLLFWGGLILLIVLVVRGFARSGNHSQNQVVNTPVNALDILKNRYARGEISKEEFETIRHDLET
ncbi:MAG: SHOCT domain-containing protein [Anaerolineae bacterium]